MSPRSDTQFAHMRAQTRAAILHAALRLFAQKGWHGTAVADIARRAKISKGLIYHYFKSKEEILEALVTQALRHALVQLQCAAPAATPQATTATMDRAHGGGVPSQSPVLVFGFFAGAGGYPKKDRPVAHGFSQPGRPHFGGGIKKLGVRDPELEVFVLNTHLDGIALNCVLAPQRFPLAAIVARVVEMYCQKLRG